MIVKGEIKVGEYFDSVTLMLVGKEASEMAGIIDAAVVMGTEENKSILASSGLMVPEFKNAGNMELLIAVKGADEKSAADALNKIIELLEKSRQKFKEIEEYTPKSLEGALQVLPEANLALISVAGKYAGDEAMKALKSGLHVMLFSDNVPLETEIELKRYATEKDLLLMGPDCGTAIINGVPLGFANVINKGDIGIVAASGTGLQEVSSVITKEGAGISQAIGTGGRDIKKAVGGIMFLQALKALGEDEQTRIIVLVSKPADEEVLEKIADVIRRIPKPIVAVFPGAETKIITSAGAIVAKTLEEAGLIAAALSQGKELGEIEKFLSKREKESKRLAEKEAKKKKEGQKYLRGVFSGGTLCDEAQLIVKEIIGDVYSNVPLRPELKLKDSWRSYKHTMVDLGGDEFTVGRLHPMIDYTLRNRRIVQEAEEPEVAVILLDIVLGYSANMKPAEELSPVLKEAREQAQKNGRDLTIVCSITGTDKDPQNKLKVESELMGAGAIIMPTNASASQLAGYIVKILGGG